MLCRDAQRRVRFAPNPADAPLGVPTIPSSVKSVLSSIQRARGKGTASRVPLPPDRDGLRSKQGEVEGEDLYQL